MRIALFDYRVIDTNPVGGCHRLLLAGLCHEHDFTVFAAEFDNPCPERITWVRVPVPLRPLALLFVLYHLVAPIYYLAYRLRHRARFDLVQMVESNLAFGDLCYVHFCHRGFLRLAEARGTLTGVRGFLRWLDHRLHALVEPRRFTRACHIVVPSRGLQRELEAEYTATAGKVTVIPNAVDLDRMTPAAGFDRLARRTELGFAPDDFVLAFVALGQFERKGLPQILDAMRTIERGRPRLLVVGGEEDLVRAYRRKAANLGLGDDVVFTGMQSDVRPFLWAADAFVLASAYEAAPLVAYEAAAAMLPLLVTRVYGIDELVVDGENGFVVERTAEGVAAGIAALAARTADERREIGRRAHVDARRYTREAFVTGWSRFYASQFGKG